VITTISYTSLTALRVCINDSLLQLLTRSLSYLPIDANQANMYR